MANNNIQKAGNRLPTTIRWFSYKKDGCDGIVSSPAKPVDYIDAQLCMSDATRGRFFFLTLCAWFLAAPIVGCLSTIALAAQLAITIGAFIALVVLPPSRGRSNPAPLTAYELSAQSRPLPNKKHKALSNAQARRLSASKRRLSAPLKRLPR
jgi:hypothetical protein